MDRKLHEKFTNVFKNVYIFLIKFFLNGPDPEQNWAGTDPNKTQTTLYWAGLSPAEWTGLMIQPVATTIGYCARTHSNPSNIISRLLCMSIVTG
jgi:hypothetical protein